MENYKVLYVDDSVLNLEVFEDEFGEIYNVITCSSYEECLTKIQLERPNLVILDVHMPGMNGIELYKSLKASFGDLPIMFYSTDDSDATLTEGLKLRPEDFLVRSMSPQHLQARIDSRLGRIYHKRKGNYSFENVDVDPASLSVQVNSSKVHLTAIEFKILDYILANRDSVIKKTDLLKAVWNDVHVESRTLNTHMSNLRGKIKDAKFIIKVNRNNHVMVLPAPFNPSGISN